MPQRQRRLPAVWSDCIIFCYFARVVGLIDRFQRWWTGGLKTHQMYMRNFDSDLVSLPVEVILHIASFMPKSSKVLLSLSSKRLRAIFLDHFDLSLTDYRQRMEVVLHLDRMLPEYLICNHCALMCKWKSRVSSRHSYFAVCRALHQIASDPFERYLYYSHHLSVTQATVDLILRAHRYGPTYGIPASHFDRISYVNGFGQMFGSCLQTEGRMVNGNFFLLRHFTTICNWAFPQRFLGYKSIYTCKHSTWKVESELVTSMQRWCPAPVRYLPTMKCIDCATDVKIRLSADPPDNTMLQVEVRVWQNYGHHMSYENGGSSIFRDLPCAIYKDDVARRDLEHDFVMGER